MSINMAVKIEFLQLFTYKRKALKKSGVLSFGSKNFPSVTRIYLFKVIFYGKV